MGGRVIRGSLSNSAFESFLLPNSVADNLIYLQIKISLYFNDTFTETL